MLAWMLYVIMVTLLLSIGAFVAERAARLTRGGTRWIWITAIVASLLLPTVMSSVALELPNILGEPVASKIVVLRKVTSEHLSPALWIAGSAEPRGWRAADPTLKQLWTGVSIAMLLALVVSGAHLLLRRQRWQRDTLAGAAVYVTSDVGPAVVGLLRPRIVVPRWLTQASPAQQASVIAHEQSHLEASDPQLFTVALALLVFMPWNLPLWWQLRRLRYAIEIDCDARVLESGVDPAHYGETLIVVGERQSAYIGAVAAMAESKSFLQERIEHMIRKPARWRRLGVATLVSVSIALTALAAEVSPPNANTPAPVAGKPEGRKAIELPASTLDRYVGIYQFGEAQTLTVRRKGKGLEAQLTAQGAIEIFPESETAFFYKVVDAQIDFVGDPGTQATSLVLHQGGANVAMPRIDAATAEQLKIDVAARQAANRPSPGSEAALRKLTAGISAGNPDYAALTPELANVLRGQMAMLKPNMESLGAIKALEFQRVGDGGWDVYRVKYANGSLLWRISMAPDGKVAYALMLPDA